MLLEQSIVNVIKLEACAIFLYAESKLLQLALELAKRSTIRLQITAFVHKKNIMHTI